MNELSLNDALIIQTRDLIHAVQGSLIQVAVNLHKIKSEGLWEAKAETWSQFTESELGISQSQASKLLAIHEHFILKGGYSPDNLIGIDYECLNMARNLSGTVEEQLSKAKTLTRRELREEKNEEVPHEHEPIQICRKCSLRL